MGVKVGVALITVGSILLVAGLVIGIVFQVYVKQHAFDGFLVYSRNSSFNDPNFQSCTNESFVAFMFNMTNSEAVLAGTEKGNFAQVGPYNFTRAVCTYNVTNDQNYEYSKKIWYPYYLLPINGVSDNDKIINWNLGYLSVMYGLEKEAPGTPPELSLAVGFLGNVLAGVFQQLTGDKFVNEAKVLGVAQVLSGIRDQVLPQVEQLVQAGAAVQYFAGTFSFREVTLDQFFNVDGVPNGIATLAGANLTFSNESQRLIFYGNPATDNITGLLADPTGKTLLTFLGSLKANIVAPYLIGYQINPTELGALGYWAGVFLYGQQWIAPLGNTSNINATALNLFYSQWANGSALDPRGLDLNGDGIVPDGFELVGPSIVSGLSATTVAALWNEQDPLSILNLNGIGLWFAALQSGNASLLTPFAIHFGLPPNQLRLVANYLVSWQNSTVEPFIKAKYGVTNLYDLAWLQWGVGILPGGASVANFDPTIPKAPEFSVWAAQNGVSVRFNITFSKQLVAQFVGTTGAAPVFFSLVQTGNFAATKMLYGLGVNETIAFAGYLNYFLVNFVDAYIVGVIFPLGGGPIVSRTPRQILWEGTDPLVNLITPNASIGAFYESDQDFPTKAAADTLEPLQNTTIYYKQGTLDDLNYFLQIRQYKGLSYIAGYHNVTVSGNKDGKNWVPNSLTQDNEVVVWYDLVRQPTPWMYRDQISVKGIDVWAYKLSTHIWEPESVNPDRAYYDQVYQGLVNITGIKTVRSFLSRPHFQGVDPIVANSVTGLDPNNPYYDDSYFGTHQASGITFVQSLKAQLSIGFPNLTRYYNISAGYAPIMWQDSYVVVSDDDANTFKNALLALNAAVIVPFVVGIGLGLILIIVGVVLVVKARRNSDEVAEIPKKGIKMQTLEINDEGVETKNNISDSD